MLRSALLTLCPATLIAQIQFQATRQLGLPPTQSIAAIAVGDVDGDGDLDIVLGCTNTTPNQLLLNDGYGRFSDETANRFVTPPGPNATHSADLADVDLDGDLDILLGNAQASTNRLYLNDGVGTFVEASSLLLPANANTTVDQVIADFNGDGSPDWFMADRPGAHLWLNNGAGTFSDVSASNLIGLPANLGYWYSHGSAADLDGDRDLDLLVPAYPVPLILWNQGNAVFASATPVAIPAYFFGTNRASDLDGDGDLDLLLDNGGYVQLNDGSGRFVDATAAAFGGVPVSSPAAFDADGDGRMDVLTATALWHNDGNARFTRQPLSVNVGLVGILHTIAADFDGDLDLDLAGVANFRSQVHAAQPPVLGASYSVSFHVPPGAPSIVAAFVSWGPDSLQAPGFGTFRLDRARMLTLAVRTVASSPWTLTWALPNQAAFRGAELHYQGLVVEPMLGAHLTNGLVDRAQ